MIANEYRDIRDRMREVAPAGHRLLDDLAPPAPEKPAAKQPSEDDIDWSVFAGGVGMFVPWG